MSELRLSFLFLLFISIPLKVIYSQDIYTERTVLLKLKQQLGNPPAIGSWKSSSSPCDWPEINCTASSVTEVHLRDKNIMVRIPPTICDLKNLTFLDLASNFIPGEFPTLYNCSKLQILDLSQNYFVGPIPDEIDRLSTLFFLDISGNNFSGNIPPSIGRLPELQTLNIYQNQFNGTFPKEIGNLSNLEFLKMAHNGFDPMNIPQEFGQLRKLRFLWMTQTNLIGEIPESFNNLSTLKHLDLSKNNLEGPIPSRLFSFKNLTDMYLYRNKLSGEIPKSIDALNMVEIDLSMNNLTGSIPEDFGKLQYLVFLNVFSNQLTGELPTSIAQLPALRDFRVFDNKLTGVLPPEFGLHSKLEGFEVSQNQFSGQLPANLCAGGVLQGVVAHTNNLSGKIPKSLENCRTLRTFQLHNNKFSDDPVLKLPDCYSKLHKPKKLSSKFLAMILALAILVSLVILLLTLFLVRDYRRKNPGRNLATWKLTSFHRLDFTEANILSNLIDSNLIGSGGSGKVYRIGINRSGKSVAVKKIWNSKKLDHKLEKEFLAEVEILGNIRHSNIVKLLCCISSEDSKLLVYDYMENQSLDRWLHGNKRKSMSGMSSGYHAVLDWPKRLQIAVGAAQGLCYMHHECPTPIIHRDVKSSNILLDSEFKAKIADFGLAKMLTMHASSHTISAVAGSFGYLAPEYAYATKVSAKVDVYSFGVVLLELVTGREANCADENMGLVEWAWQHFSEDKSIVEILDPKVKESSCLEEMIMVYKVGIVCTRASPSTRPSMKEVLHVLSSSCAPDGHGAKSVGSDFDVAPLLGTATYLSSYKQSQKGSEEDECIIYNV
ncbi:receptor-like protein kinase HSL1 isoform X2 [Durio zibethinus]|uniref:Receptor-like protein kinase HSL1 isoform X2 n=1 Tax=Durio zibethinus TaxID=66656 RepID=A0A6P5ZCE7_DURZI|nr:receptor-like protein kinase HSL1 isoform X2 [Durio zibethinus]